MFLINVQNTKKYMFKTLHLQYYTIFNEIWRKITRKAMQTPFRQKKKKKRSNNNKFYNNEEKKNKSKNFSKSWSLLSKTFHDCFSFSLCFFLLFFFILSVVFSYVRITILKFATIADRHRHTKLFPFHSFEIISP